MKRQALGKGLGSLIPGRDTLDALATEKGKAGAEREAQPPQMSAADIERASRKRTSHRAPAGEQTVRNRTAEDAGPPVVTSAEVDEGQVAHPVEAEPASRALGHETAAMDDASTQVVIGASSPSLQWVDIDRIRPNPQQPRRHFPEAEIEELAASIRSSGILQPVIVRRVDGGYGLVAGERRWRAAQRVGLHRIPALIREIPDERLIEVALIENLQRQDLNPIEEAEAYSALVEEHGLTQADVAERVGKQRTTVANSLRLLGLPPKVKDMVRGGVLSMGHARALLSLPGPRAQELGADIVSKRALSVRETESWVSRHTEDPVPRPEPTPRDPNVRAAEEGLQRRLGTRVKILQGRGGKGRILVEFFSPAELDRLYERLIKA